MRSDKYLKKMYNEYNREFFGNKLPKAVKVAYAENKRQLFIECQSKKALACAGGNHIFCNIDMKKLRWWNLIRATMLHEMCHVKCDLDDLLTRRKPMKDPHGPRFQREMLRLAVKGAFANLW